MQRVVAWFKASFVVLFFVSVFGYAVTVDMEEAQATLDLYCERVRDGTWPDYRGEYTNLCVRPYWN
jgi:hypothetical protein